MLAAGAGAIVAGLVVVALKFREPSIDALRRHALTASQQAPAGPSLGVRGCDRLSLRLVGALPWWRVSQSHTAQR